MKKVVIYTRVSTSNQTVENQIIELQLVAKRLDWNVVSILSDQGISGSEGRIKRPAFDMLLDMVSRKEIDLIATWSVDRLGRSLQHLVSFLDQINNRNVDLYLHQQNLDTSTPSGRAMFQMISVFSEFERGMIQERVRAGLARARASGTRLGRPKINLRTKERIKEMLNQGHSINKVAKACHVGNGTVHRIKVSLFV